jgi:hypothetical protein
MREVINLAIRRVTAFVRFGLDGLDDRDGGDFALTASIVYSFGRIRLPKVTEMLLGRSIGPG